MKRAAPDIWDCVDGVVTGLGYDFVGARCGHEDGNLVLRVFIDADDGITVDDCGDVSHQLSAVLDVEDLLNAAYVLEVSSPGVDRPLFEQADFARFVGDIASIKLLAPQDGRRKFKGELIACEGNEIEIEVDGERYAIPVTSIDQAHLVPPAEAYKARR